MNQVNEDIEQNCKSILFDQGHHITINQPTMKQTNTQEKTKRILAEDTQSMLPQS